MKIIFPTEEHLHDCIPKLKDFNYLGVGCIVECDCGRQWMLTDRIGPQGWKTDPYWVTTSIGYNCTICQGK